jgi:hypothetical protein
MAAIRESVVPVLEQLLPRPAVRSILATLPSTADAPVGTLDLVAMRHLLDNLEAGLKTFGTRLSGGEREQLKARVTGGKLPSTSELVLRVETEHDLKVAQRSAQTLLRGFFEAAECVCLAAAVSDLARGIHANASKASITLSVSDEGSRVRLDVVAIDKGPPVAHPAELLAGKHAAKTPVEKGLVAMRRLFDDVTLDVGPGRSTTVRAVKRSGR